MENTLSTTFSSFTFQSLPLLRLQNVNKTEKNKRKNCQSAFQYEKIFIVPTFTLFTV